MLQLYGAETGTWKIDQEHLENFEILFYWRMEKISSTDHIKDEILHRIKDERSILNTIKQKKANWIGHILHRNCLIKHVIVGKIQGMVRRGRCKHLLDDTKKRRYWCLKWKNSSSVHGYHSLVTSLAETLSHIVLSGNKYESF